MTTRAEFVAEARKWIGTKFHRGQRTIGVGVDCALPVILIERLSGRKVDDEWLRRVDHFKRDTVLEVMRRCYAGVEPEKTTVDEAKPGDIVSLYFDRRLRYAQHIAIVTDIGILHSMERVGTVEHDFNSNWTRRVVDVYVNPIVED